MKVNDIREQLKKAKLARLRYAEKKAASLGVKVEEYLDEKKKKRLLAFKKRKADAIKRQKIIEKELKEKIERIKLGKEKVEIDYQVVSVTIPYAKKIEGSYDYDKCLDKIIKILKDKKLGYYDGDEWGFGPAKHFRWYFYLNSNKKDKSITAKRAGGLISTIVKKEKWSKGVEISMNIQYTDDSYESSKTKIT